MWRSSLLHALPFAHGEAGDAWLTIALLTLGTLLAVGIGFGIGGLARARPELRPLAQAFSAGALTLLVFDLLKESASLGQGLLGQPVLQLGLLASFGAGALLLPFLAGPRLEAGRLGWAWVIGLSAHGAGEGWIVGTEASSSSLAPLGTLSYLIHKGVEAFTIPFVMGAPAGRTRSAAFVVALTSAVAAAALLGWRVGPATLPLLLFAAGAGAAAMAIVRLASGFNFDVRHGALFVAGAVFVYAAGFLHEL